MAQGPLHFYLNDDDMKSEGFFMRSAKRRFGGSDRAKPTISVGTKSKPSVIDKIREKTMMLKLRQQNESSILMVATKINYKDFSPQIWFFVCRITSFIWCYAYHDFQSWVLLAWIMHSTLFKSMKSFFSITMNYYLPFFVLTFVFYYIINIPRVVEF